MCKRRPEKKEPLHFDTGPSCRHLVLMLPRPEQDQVGALFAVLADACAFFAYCWCSC